MEAARKGKININMARVAVEAYKGFIGVLRRIGIVVGEEGRGWEEDIGKEKEYIEEKEEVSDLNRGLGEKEDKRWDEEVEKGGWARERRNWDDEGEQRDRNWAWMQNQKEGITCMKKTFLDMKRAKREKEEEEEKREQNRMKDRDADEEELIGGFKKSPWAVEKEKE